MSPDGMTFDLDEKPWPARVVSVTTGTPDRYVVREVWGDPTHTAADATDPNAYWVDKPNGRLTDAAVTPGHSLGGPYTPGQIVWVRQTGGAAGFSFELSAAVPAAVVVRCGTLVSSSPRPYYAARVRRVTDLSTAADADPAADVYLTELGGSTLTPGVDYLAVRAGAVGTTPPVPLYWTAAGPRNPSAAVLTENTSPDSGKYRQLNGSFVWSDGATLTNVVYPVEVDGVVMTPKPTANGILWADPAQPGKYDFVPLQYADAVPQPATLPTSPPPPSTPVYYAGLMSTGTQFFTGGKYFKDGAFTYTTFGQIGGGVYLEVSAALGATLVGTYWDWAATAPAGVNTFVHTLKQGVTGTEYTALTVTTRSTGTVLAVDEVDAGVFDARPSGIVLAGTYTAHVGGVDYGGATATVSGLVFKAGLYVSGSISFPPPPPPPSGYSGEIVGVDGTWTFADGLLVSFSPA
jgi:hypothetical protein